MKSKKIECEQNDLYGLEPKTLWLSGRRSSNWASSGIDVLNRIMYYAISLHHRVQLW